jgi:hypothetical protein
MEALSGLSLWAALPAVFGAGEFFSRNVEGNRVEAEASRLGG